MSNPNFMAQAAALLTSLPHSRALGLQVDAVGAATATLSMGYDDRLVGDPETGVIHGGAVSALMDSACGAAVLTHPEAPRGTATIDFRMDYMRSATPGQRIVARAECYHITRNVAFVRATAFDDDITRPVATATATWTVERGE